MWRTASNYEACGVTDERSALSRTKYLLTWFSPFRVGQAEGQVFEAKEGKRLSLAAACW
jgi:hypothetical protein